jgi:TolB-like protein/Flp pilus assembly protein TadD
MTYSLPDKPSIAVLPFTNMSDDPKQEYFADGMTEDLITDLSQMSGLFVIARNSTFVYKGKAVKIRQVAEELGVRYVLEGSVRKAGDQVRINTQLIDATTGHHLWAKRYDGKMGDIFALQDKITQKIVSALTVKLTEREQSQIAKKETDNIEAYDVFLKGWAHYLRFTPSDFTEAISYFKKAIDLDPNYARAYAGLARTYEEITALRWHERMGIVYIEACLRARQYLRMAMKSPTSIAYEVAAVMDLKRHQYNEAIEKAERALTLDPNDPSCYAAMGRVLIYSGKPKEALAFLERGKRLDPQNPGLYLYLLGWAYFFMEQYEQAVTLIERAIKHNPEAEDWELTLAAAYGHLGRTQEASPIIEALENYVRYDYRTLLSRQDMPFRNQEDTDRFYNGLYLAGLSKKYTFYKIYDENKLTQAEMKSIFFGRKFIEQYPRTGTHMPMLIDNQKEGAAYYRKGTYSESGKCWIDGDLFCYKWDKLLKGRQYCATVFRNPKDDPREKFIKVYDFGIRTCTPID